MKKKPTEPMSAPKRLRGPAAVMGLLAGAALCLALPALLCMGEGRTLENTALERPALANEEPDTIAGDPLADALYRSRVLYGDQGEGEPLDVATEEVREMLADVLDALHTAGVADDEVTRAAEEILAGEALEAGAQRRPDGTRKYSWVGSGQFVEMIWQPELQLPLEFDVYSDTPGTLPDGEPGGTLDAWTAFLGQQDAGDWQQLPELNDACTVYSPARELCLYLYREEGRAAWRVYSLSRQETDDLTEMLIDYRDNIQAAAMAYEEA